MLAGNFSTSATVQLQPGQTLMGAGMLTVRTAGGHVATVATPGGATITGAVPGNAGAVTMGNNSTLTGMTVSNVSTGGGVALGINVVQSSATVTGNTLEANGGGGTNSRALGLANANILAGSSGNTIVSGICLVGGAGAGTQVGFTNAASCGP